VGGNTQLGDDPARLSGSVLDLILVLSRAHCGAVFSVVASAPVLVASQGLHHEALAAAVTLWRERQAHLARGDVIYQPAAMIIPVTSTPVILGFLYADAPDPAFRFQIGQLGTFTEILMRAMRAVTCGAGQPGPILGLGWTVDAERSRLCSLLEAHEWNVARVARICGVQRQTVYNWLERLGIDRKKLPKATT
jgi:hypothetical protein